MNEHLLTIREAAEIAGVSIDTLRRWDESGKLVAIRKNGGTHRYYREADLLVAVSDLAKMATDWALTSGDIPSSLYSADSAIFQTRVSRMEMLFGRNKETATNYSVFTSLSGEIGNNSFDHNLGKWPDVPGVFFGYSIEKRVIVLADRGIGVLETLRRVRPSLSTHRDALHTAFTEVLSGRAPEARGNGLKYVLTLTRKYGLELFCQSGDAELRVSPEKPELRLTRSPQNIRGFLAIIKF